MSETKTKPQLHVSMLDTLSKCGIQFQRRYGKLFGCWHQEEKIPPGIALLTGTAVHKSVEANLRNKIESGNGSMLEREHAIIVGVDEFQNQITSGDILLSEDEALDIKKTFGESKDMVARLSALHYDNIAPFIKPVAVEEKFVLEMPNYPVDLAGTKDVRESDGTIRDTKTIKSTPQDSAAKTIQTAMYAMSEKVIRGKLPLKVTLDFLIKLKTPEIKICEAVPKESWMKPLFARIERAIDLIQSSKEGKAAFTPADPSHWICTKKFCGYSSTCKFWSGR